MSLNLMLIRLRHYINDRFFTYVEQNYKIDDGRVNLIFEVYEGKKQKLKD